MTEANWSEYYDSSHPLHYRLAGIASLLLQQHLDVEGIKYLSVSARVKDKESYLEKIERKKYDNPAIQLMDFSGVRVVTFLPKQVDEVCNHIRSFFEVDDENSMDKLGDLGTDKVGYQSWHFICSLGAKRSKLPEYKDVSSLKFEVQVRTILQHAWAELAHGKSYKFSSRLPSDLQRRLNLHAGTLELVDIGLDELSTAIDLYADKIRKDDKSLLSEPINSISLKEYVQSHFPNAEAISKYSATLDDLVDEVKAFGFELIGDLDKLVTASDLENISRYENRSVAGVIRKILLGIDPGKYFEISWKGKWDALRPSTYEFLKDKFGDDQINGILKKHSVRVLG